MAEVAVLSARMPETTVDAFLGGRVEAIQPADGRHRSGLEAVLLAASFDPQMHGMVVDLGAGAGVAGLCVAARCPDTSVILVERDEIAAACARDALMRPANAAFAGRVRVVEADIASREGLATGLADAVMFNPPFYEVGSASASPAKGRAGAHMLGEEGLDPWFRAASALTRPGGTATVVFRADGLEMVIGAAKGRFGALDILPVAPRPGTATHRILVRGVKGSRAPLRLLSPLVLHEGDGNAFRPEVDAMLRGAVGLSAVIGSWVRDGGRTT